MQSSNNLKNRRRQVSAILFLAMAVAGCGREAAPPAGERASAQAKPAPAGAPAHDEGKGLKLSPEESKAAGLRVETVTMQDVRDQLSVTATILANQDRLARLAPRVPGRLIQVSANLGDSIKAGQSMAVLDSLEVGEARSAHAQAESEASVAKAAWQRAEKLQAEQILSQKESLRAKADYDKAQAALRATSEKLHMLGVTNGASNNIASFALTAPFAGVVIEKKAVIGELAQPDKSVFTVADLSTLWIEANLTEKDLGRVHVGNTAAISVEAYPKEVFKGRLTHVGGVLDKETRTVRARIEVKNSDGRLKPEMFATAAIDTGSSTKAMVLPDDAVVLISGQPTVFIEEHGGFEPRPIEIGLRLQARVVVKSGVAPDDKVVVAGAYALKARLLKSQIGDSH